MPFLSALTMPARVDAQRSQALDADTFRLVYDRTAKPLRAYLWRMLGDGTKVDDLLQESYLRLLQAKLPTNMADEHLKNYLFRIATNLVRTEQSKRRASDVVEEMPDKGAVDRDLQRGMEQCLNRLPPRQRELLWLAYVERFSHEEIAATVGAKTPSIRPMLARARQSLSEILKAAGFSPVGRAEGSK